MERLRRSLDEVVPLQKFHLFLLGTTTFFTVLIVHIQYSRKADVSVAISSAHTPEAQGRSLGPSLQKLMSDRRRLINSTCAKYEQHIQHVYRSKFGVTNDGKGHTLRMTFEFHIVVNHNLAWCEVAKAGSTSVVKSFMELFGLEKKIRNFVSGRALLFQKFFLRPSHFSQHPFPSNIFLVVRHPFSRLVSAYRDKFLDRCIKKQFINYQQQYGIPIIKKHRVAPPPSEDFTDVPTFPEFVAYLIHTNPLQYNRHWIPIYISCTVCNISYNIILHLESLSDEVEYLINVTGIPELRPEHIRLGPILSQKEEILTAHESEDRGQDDLEKNKIRVQNNEEDIDESYVEENQLEDDSAVPKESSQTQIRRKTNCKKRKRIMKSDSNIRKRNREQAKEINSKDSLEKMYFSMISRAHLDELYQIYKYDMEMFGYSLSPYDQYVTNG